MDILISLGLLGVVLTPLVIVVRDLLAARRSHHHVSDLPLAYGSHHTYPSLALLEDMEDTAPACLRREVGESAAGGRVGWEE